MSDSRIVTMRKSETINLMGLRLPLLFIQAQFGYSVDSILRPIHGMPKIHMGTYPDTFPNTITEYYWIQEGAPGLSLWMALGKLSNDLYFFYTAQCSDTQKTFLDNGHMNLWVSTKYGDLIHYAMDKLTYQKYIKDTLALENQ